MNTLLERRDQSLLQSLENAFSYDIRRDPKANKVVINRDVICFLSEIHVAKYLERREAERREADSRKLW